MFYDALFRLVRIVGSRKNIATHVKTSIRIVNNWFTRDQKIRVEHALAIETLTAEIADKEGIECVFHRTRTEDSV
jgi:DNA-binding transcriptional regulator YdaS (Cro superfamily)